MSSPDLLLALLPVIERLEELNIRYHIGGSVASSAVGMARTTLDVDLVADLQQEHAAPLARLRNRYYVDEDAVADAIRRHSCFNLIHLETMFKIDIFVLTARPYDQVAFHRAHKELVFEGVRELPLATAEDIVLNKLEWYRGGQEVSERQWRDVLGVLKVQASNLDVEYMRHWAEHLAVADLLERCLREAEQTSG